MLTRAYTVKFTDQTAQILNATSFNPLDKLTEAITNPIEDMAASIYIAAKELFLDFAHFIFVDLLGNVSELLILIGCLAIVLGSTKLAGKTMRWGAIGFLISLLASYGWSV